ncbi:constitutive coactivator of PPAR-gamma-like protein 1 homolog isoform X2 [Mercenaria mercenaria]|uniref:constitutive coactivator of PPAR-gamma-like protein 1 homolog isoform X2 n=1 Tax=Mercenaria mercenaria TaxID=6596 RepID=UPI00234ECEF2|nr:constitutive coactivator of PPAR-gamma-like protein 1 homolog isoform X2 [Mercenaria mercenaria]
MGIKDLQAYLETHCSSACLSVDLLKISKSFVPKRRGRVPGSSRFCLIVDAESCLDRLYGGYFSDWVCGGQWNRMLTFLSNLLQACQMANMELVVFFNGALESQKMDTWYSAQLNQKKKVNMVLRHIYNRGTPPPKVWWNPPIFLSGALRLALRQLGIGVAMSMDDHEQEVIAFCREHGLQGILGQNAVYAIFDPPRYFSNQNLKLTYKGSLETKEYVMDEIAKSLDLNPNRFCLCAALLGNHILTEEDLYDFYKDLLSRASQDAAKTIKPNPDNVIHAVVDYVRGIPDISNMDYVGDAVFRDSAKGNKLELISKLKQSVQYYFNGTEEGFLRYNPRPSLGNFPPQMAPNKPTQDFTGYGTPMMNGAGANRTSPDGDGNIPVPKQVKTHVGGREVELPQVSPEIMRIASERHQKGMMSPWVYQVLSQGEIKMVVTLEDESVREVPTSMDLFRSIRKTVYSVLLNLNKLKIVHENQGNKRVDGTGAAPMTFEVPIKEWVVRRVGSQKPSFDLVMAKPVEWKTPSIERMWLGQQPEDKTRRLRAFLTVMHSDTPLMLNTNYVPQHLLILSCVLRYMLEFGRILQRQELDAFLAMSVSPLLHDVQTMQDLKLPSVQPRGVALAALFMAGVEVAQFANDVCGAPVPWNMVCPWQFFDGKLFHFKLLKANNNTPLIDMCDGQVEQVLRVERLRQAIMENLQFEFAKPFLPSAAMYAGYPMPYGQAPGGPFPYRPAGMGRMPGGPPPPQGGRGMGMGFMGPPEMGPPNPGRGRGILGRSPVDGRGGQLEIAGVVVGSWGPNLSASSRGRGGNQMQPRVMSVGGPRRGGGRGMFYRGGMGPRGMRGGRGMMGGRGMPGRGMMMPMYRMPERPFYGRMGRGSVRGIRRPAVKARPKPGGKKKAPKGRGMTVEGVTSDSSEQVKADKSGDDEDDENFEDAEDDEEDANTGAIGKQLMQNGLQSPDSGIHGDKSATDLTLSA